MALARPWAVERAIDRRPSLTGEQAEMVRRLTRDGDGVAVVVGPAGAGKTYALAAAREAWEASGRRVYGAALARRAARELEDDAGIPSTSVAALLDALAHKPYSPLPRRAVLVLDEAGMLPTRALAELVEHARRLDAKLVLVGDHRQLPAIGAGGAFRGLMTRLPVIELHENRRQLAQWERDALRSLRAGDAPEAVQRYDAAERIVVGENAAELRRRLVDDWWTARDPDGAVMIAQRRIDVDDLNGRAHALMRAAGGLGAGEVKVAGAAFSAGDHVVVRRNDRALGVVNGDRGVVAAVDSARGQIDLALARGQVSLPRDYLERPTRHGRPALMHGYAITAYLAQGMTCRETFILATDQLTREAGYVALSRGRKSNRLYALAPTAAEREEYAPTQRDKRDARSALIDGLQRSRAQTLASDTARPSPRAAELAEITRQRGVVERTLWRSQADRRRLEDKQPSWYRPRTRARHAAALAHATETERRAERQLLVLTTRHDALRGELRQELAANRQPARAREPERPFARHRDRGMELGC